jgi:hypothetical protein
MINLLQTKLSPLQLEQLSGWDFDPLKIVNDLESARLRAMKCGTIGPLVYFTGLVKDALGISQLYLPNSPATQSLLQALAMAYNDLSPALLKKLNGEILSAMRTIFILMGQGINLEKVLNFYHSAIDKKVTSENFDALMLWQILHGNTHQFSFIAERVSLLIKQVALEQTLLDSVQLKFEILVALNERNSATFLKKVEVYKECWEDSLESKLGSLVPSDLYDYFLHAVVSIYDGFFLGV